MVFNLRKKKRSLKSGFTLVEALVAISILVLATVGALGVAQGGLQSAFFARDQMTAFYLAQEAIEMVKNQRHHNLLEDPDQNWLKEIGPGQSNCGNAGCSVDAVTENFHSAGPGSSRRNVWIDENGFYRSAFTGDPPMQGWEFSGFKRFFSISTFSIPTENGNANYGATITATVRWKDGEELIVTEHIFRWHEN